MSRAWWALLLTLTCGALGEEACEPEVTSTLQTAPSKAFEHFTGTPNETKWLLRPRLKGKSGNEGLFPYNLMTCKGTQALTTKSMTSEFYDEIVAKVQALYNQLPHRCAGMDCSQADFAGCVLRIAGHDFMDYMNKEDIGGSDGCLDMNDPDNGGLADCMYVGADLGVSIADVYVDICEKVSLADFFVIAANAVVKSTREEVIKKHPHAKPVDLKSVFRYGRTTRKQCYYAKGQLPNPEESCKAVKKVFVHGMGLSWKQAAALMAVHTLGRAQKKNSGYDGWWSDAVNSREFNNNYFVSLMDKGWGPETNVGGNPNKNQWKRVDRGLEKEARAGKEMMLNTDMCLVWTNDYHGKVDMNAATASKYGCQCAWVGPRESERGWKKYNYGKFCGTTYVPDDFPSGWVSQRKECCGQTNRGGKGIDCGDPEFPAAPAYEWVRLFTEDEDAWLSTFRLSWKKATENGFAKQLKKLS